MTLQLPDVSECIQRLRTAVGRTSRSLRFMEVCGTHTMNACRTGLHSLMPESVQLVSGPGCPVCVTPPGEIDQLVELASQPGVVLCTYGDMLRVPGSGGSLEQVRAAGGDVRVVYSALDAVHLAARETRRQVVFAAVGFETTAPATAVAILEADRLWLHNFTAYVSHRRILPAMRALLERSEAAIDGFLCPGHVSIVTGADSFRSIVEEYGKACVIAGFEGPQIAAALARLAECAADGVAVLENQYTQAVAATGNRCAQQFLSKVVITCDVYWRGLGEIRDSGLQLLSTYHPFDARVRYQLKPPSSREPKGCRCGDVITGRANPGSCPLFGGACTPVRPVGPCMVSSEGSCQAWFKYGDTARRRIGVQEWRRP
jgi:hydrogenase expression/formation protein HypD